MDELRIDKQYQWNRKQPGGVQSISQHYISWQTVIVHCQKKHRCHAATDTYVASSPGSRIEKKRFGDEANTYVYTHNSKLEEVILELS